MEKNIHIQKAVDFFGSQTGLAKALGGKVRQGHVYQWLNNMKRVMPETAAKINRATLGDVKATDFYPFLKNVEPPKSNHLDDKPTPKTEAA